MICLHKIYFSLHFMLLGKKPQKKTNVLGMTCIFASLTSKSSLYDTCVYVDNYVENEDLINQTVKNRHSFHFADKFYNATQIAKKPNRSILLCEVKIYLDR